MNNILNTFFEKVYCINLDHRTDRWSRVSKHFDKIGLTVERFTAINGDVIDNQSKISNGAYGCALSHRAIIEKCKSNNVKSVLILEDDVLFKQNFQYHMMKNIRKIKSWDMVFLGGNHLDMPTIISNGLFKIKNCYASHAYGVNSNFYEKYLDVTSNMDIPIDVNLASIQWENDCFVFTTTDEEYSPLTLQESGYSDIEKHNVCYHGCFNPLKNFHE